MVNCNLRRQIVVQKILVAVDTLVNLSVLIPIVIHYLFINLSSKYRGMGIREFIMQLI